MPFRLGEAVFCYHGPMLYEAKVESVEIRPGAEPGGESTYYYVHYKGWNTKWDEFVRSERVLPINDETKKQQAELRVKHHKERKRPVDKSDRPDTPAKTGHELPKGTKRTREERPPPDIKPSLNLDIPEYLRYLLVDDWEAITRNMQLPPLPRQPTVKEIFAVYREETARHPRLKLPASTTDEWLEGLQLYFDKSLGNYLLYRFEREQYLHIRQEHGNDYPMSEIYGAEHLLRLFVTLPDLVAGTQMDVLSVENLRELASDLLRWLAGNQTKFFVWPLEQYDNSTSAYQNISRM